MGKLPYRPRLSKQESELISNYRAIARECKEQGVDVKDVKHIWLKSKSSTLFLTNPAYGDSEHINFDINKFIGDVEPVVFERNVTDFNWEIDNLVFTDVHIGMDASDKGRSLYDLKWNKEIVVNRLNEMIQFTLDNQKSNTLLIDDLGDFLDGLNGYTTRGGHSLPQNMSNQEAFDLAFEFKLNLVQALAPHFDKIIFNNIVNDNHSGDFAYFVASALKNYCEKAYSNVEVIIQNKFIDYQVIGKRCFVTTHGKDTHNVKFGFKAKLDPKQINQIVGYLNENKLLNKGYEIIFKKGDSHQYLFDNSSTDIFCYLNFPAFSVSSNWVQANFQRGKSGFIHFNYNKKQKTINEYIFDND